jgi:hypothetical protein
MPKRKRDSTTGQFSTIISSTGSAAIKTIKRDLRPTVDRYFAPIRGFAIEVGRTIRSANTVKKGG